MEIKPRYEIMKFAVAMEIKMRSKDPTKGDSWKSMDLVDLSQLLDNEYGEWTMSVSKDLPDSNELVDLANIAMMLWNRDG